MQKRLMNILISLDQTFFVLLTLGAANPDETPSAAAWRLEQAGRWQGKLLRPAIDWIFLHLFGQKRHCYAAWLAENKFEVWNGIDQ